MLSRSAIAALCSASERRLLLAILDYPFVLSGWAIRSYLCLRSVSKANLQYRRTADQLVYTNGRIGLYQCRLFHGKQYGYTGCRRPLRVSAPPPLPLSFPG